MKFEERYLWRYRWAGRMVTSAFPMTREAALKAHPEAVPVAGSMVTVEIADSPEEREAAYRAMSRQPRNFRPE